MLWWISLVFVLAAISLGSAEICNKVCDNANSESLTSFRNAATSELHGRTLQLLIDDKLNAGFGAIYHGESGDEIWIDRSWGDGTNWKGHLGISVIPENANTVTTTVFNLDGRSEKKEIGLIRACIVANLHPEVACTKWKKALICHRICDSDNTTHIEQTRTISTRTHHGRIISCIVSDKYNVGFARISNGKPGDDCWIDRSWDSGKTWDGHLGDKAIPENDKEASTPVYNIDGSNYGQVGVIRACGTDHDGIVCTKWHRVIAPSDPSMWICNPICDFDNSDHIEQTRTISTRQHHGRIISCIVSDKDNVGFAKISNGKPGDDCWIDRSWDSGKTWDGRLGLSAIPEEAVNVSTPVFNIDGSRPGQVGVIRACGSDHDGVVCTELHRIRAYNETSVEPLICSARNICDNENAERLIELERRRVSTAEVFGRQITLIISSEEKVGFATISNGDPTDEVWIDRRWHGGSSWDNGSRVGFSVIPENESGVSTPLYNIEHREKMGSIRACGKPGYQDDVVCTLWYRYDLVCNIVCDSDYSTHLQNIHIDSTKEFFGRQISLIISDGDKAGFARILDGKPGDEIWVERRWNGSASGYNGYRLGHSVLSADAQDVDTPLFNFIGSLNNGDIQAIRACCMAKHKRKIICTEWNGAIRQMYRVRSKVLPMRSKIVPK